jgi:putative NADH-flavin reductase
MTVRRGDVTDLDFVAEVARDHDVVASAISPAPSNMGVLSDAAKSLLHASRASGRRVVAVGGAGSLKVAPGKQLLDTPEFPADWRPTALAHRDALQVFEQEGGEGWTVVSPAALTQPGKRTGRFRWGTDQLVADKKGNSRISMEDYAIAFVDEVESGRNLGRRITVGY